MEERKGKGAPDENFPVGSWLLPARTRPHVAAFYAFARTADDVADDPGLGPEGKLRRLDAMAAALAGEDGEGVARDLRRSLATTGVSPRHALDLLDAFRQDAVQARYADWAALMEYCDRSAAPVGRYLLDLHGEPARLWPAADALCNALQVLNHLQDCGEDHRRLARVYLPMRWMGDAGATPGDLDAPALSPALRRVLDRGLDGVDGLLGRARPLASAMGNRRLAMETAAIQAIAERLAAALRTGDPLATRVRLGRRAYLAAAGGGVARILAGRIFRPGPRKAGAFGG